MTQVFKIKKIIFYFWLCWVFTAISGLSLVAESKGYCSLCVFLIAAASHCGAQAPGARGSVVVALGLSSCGSWA